MLPPQLAASFRLLSWGASGPAVPEMLTPALSGATRFNVAWKTRCGGWSRHSGEGRALPAGERVPPPANGEAVPSPSLWREPIRAKRAARALVNGHRDPAPYTHSREPRRLRPPPAPRVAPARGGPPLPSHCLLYGSSWRLAPGAAAALPLPSAGDAGARGDAAGEAAATDGEGSGDGVRSGLVARLCHRLAPRGRPARTLNTVEALAAGPISRLPPQAAISPLRPRCLPRGAEAPSPPPRSLARRRSPPAPRSGGERRPATVSAGHPSPRAEERRRRGRWTTRHDEGGSGGQLHDQPVGAASAESVGSWHRSPPPHR